MTQQIKLKRAYEASAPDDGFRIYIDRLWPQGLSHETFTYDLWDKEISPSTQLREWFHSTEDWPEFVRRYTAELKANPALPQLKQTIADKPIVTLLYSSRNEQHNNAIVLRQVLLSKPTQF